MAKKNSVKKTMGHNDPIADIKSKKFHPPTGYKEKSQHHRKTSFKSTRRATYRGHEIVVYTTYQIKIDGEALAVHTMVNDDGKVHSHGLPNYSFPSALDLARAIIDTRQLSAIDRDDLNASHYQEDKDPEGEHGGHG